MSDPAWHWWDLVGPFISGATAVISGAVGLLAIISKRFQTMHSKIEQLKTVLHGRIDTHAAQIARQEVTTATLIANEMHYARRLDGIERSVISINAKQDEQTAILYEIKGKMEGER